MKVHASDDAGVIWHELPSLADPPQPEGEPVAGVAWQLAQIWPMEQTGDTLWAGTLAGGLFRSPDAGEWRQLNEPLWNQPGRAGWFGGGYDVPGILSICPHPTRPGETSRTGLPQQDCHDLVYRHGLAAHASGEHLLIASTTGNLWASDDGGDR